MNNGTLGFPARSGSLRAFEAVGAVHVDLNTLGDYVFTMPQLGRFYFPQQVFFRNTGIVASLTTAQVGLFTLPGGGGTAIIASGTALSGITTNADNTAANGVLLTGTTMALRLAAIPRLYLRVTQVQAAGATVDAVLYFRPQP